MLIRSNHNVSQNQFHFVFVTKYRKKLFKYDSTRRYIKSAIYHIAQEKNIFVKNLEIMEDHIHLLCQAPSNMSASYLASLFKSFTTRWLRRKYPYFQKLNKIFSPSFYSGTCGAVSQITIYKYIQTQRREDQWKKSFNVA